MDIVALVRPQVNTPINKISVQRIAQQFSFVPQELKLRPQWVVWKWGELRLNGKRTKAPINPHTGRYASPTDPSTWGTYLEAIIAYTSGLYAGIGFVFNGEGIAGIDLDHCIQGGRLEPWAQEIIDQINGYTEISPSGKGVKIIVRAAPRLDRGNRKDGRIEIYSSNRFFTLTGQCISKTIQLEDRQAQVEAWYHTTFPPITLWNEQIEESPHLEDNQIIDIVMRAKNGAKFKRLWEGNTKGYVSRSEGDLALFSLLAPYTQDAEQLERIARRSGLLRDKWDTHPSYLRVSIHTAIDNREFTYQPRKQVDSRTEHCYPWQQSHNERDLQEIAQGVKESAQRHIEEGEESVLVIQVPPGVGKSTTVSEWGKDQDIAYIVQRHEQVNQVQALQEYRHILPCTDKNCSEAETANRLSALGYNAWPLHRKHRCEYGEQFYEDGSAVYQIAHAQTAHPVQHSGIVVDELDIAGWIMKQVITAEQVKQAAINRPFYCGEWEASLVLKALKIILQDDQMIFGKALFDRFNEECGGKLEEYVTAVAQNENLMEERPMVGDVETLEKLKPVILPTMVKAIQRELPHWKTGKDWNSRIRVDKHNGEYVLIIQEPRRFQGSVPLTILDATAQPDLYATLFGRPVQRKVVQVNPPPNMKHIAVRTGKRYAKYTLTEGKKQDRDVQRVVKELRYLLKEIDPQRTKSVGLITYQGCEDSIGDALGIPERYRGHFWGVRGSNAFEDCEILLVVGTPTPNLDEIVHWARMLYADDPIPIDTTLGPDGKYQDRRLRELVEYLINAELTQVAHRNRPLRHDGRTVITLSSGTVDYLPITTEIHQLPQLNDGGKSQTAYDLERVHRAEAALKEKGLPVTVRTMKEEIGRPGISSEKLTGYVRQLKAGRAN